MKTCKVCGQEKEEKDFYISNNCVMTICKKCRNDSQREYWRLYHRKHRQLEFIYNAF